MVLAGDGKLFPAPAAPSWRIGVEKWTVCVSRGSAFNKDGCGECWGVRKWVPPLPALRGPSCGELLGDIRFTNPAAPHRSKNKIERH